MHLSLVEINLRFYRNKFHFTCPDFKFFRSIVHRATKYGSEKVQHLYNR